jgi:hypothetical protein
MQSMELPINKTKYFERAIGYATITNIKYSITDLLLDENILSKLPIELWLNIQKYLIKPIMAQPA